MMTRLLLCVVVLFVGVGCLNSPAPPHDNGKIVTPVVKPGVNQAAAAMRQLAEDRAANWRGIVARIRSREIKTVAELEAAAIEADEAAADNFNTTLVAYLKQLLNGSEDELPDNAADVLSAIPDGFGDALK